MNRGCPTRRALAAGVATALLALAAQAGAGQCFSGGRPPQQVPGGFRIAGVAEGLVSGVALDLNRGVDQVVLEQPGAFRFTRPLRAGSAYAVEIRRHPPLTSCRVLAGNGLVLGEVDDLRVECQLGAVTGLPTPEGAAGGTLGPLLRHADGTLYAISAEGGQHGHGGIVGIAADGNRNLLHSFADAESALAPMRLALDAAGQHLLGVTHAGGEHGGGTLYRMRVDGSNHQVLRSFGGELDSDVPSSPLLAASDGWFYGLSANGGPYNGGTLYRVHPDHGFQIVHGFAQPDALLGGQPPDARQHDGEQGLYFPRGEMVEGGGRLYGAAVLGGRHGAGGVFEYDLRTRQLRPLASLPRHQPPLIHGLTLGGGGELYALSDVDSQECARVLRIGTDGSLDGWIIDPRSSAIAYPQGTLAQGSDGRLYGTSVAGGRHGRGTLYVIDPRDDSVAVRFHFDRNRLDSIVGDAPRHGLLLAANGDLYGTTSSGGTTGRGAVFRID